MYNTVVRLCQFFCCGGKVLLRPEKKVLVVCLAGARSLLRPEKKVLVVIVITTGKKSSSRLFGGCAIIIMTGKKSSSRDSYYDRKKKVLVICLAGARSLLRPE